MNLFDATGFLENTQRAESNPSCVPALKIEPEQDESVLSTKLRSYISSKILLKMDEKGDRII